MRPSAETDRSPLDTPKLVLAVGLVAAGIAGFYYYGDEPLLYRVVGLLAVCAAAVGVILTTQPGRALWQFAQSSKQEVRKVVWPTRQETLQTTLIVVAVVMLVAIFLWLLDILLLWIMGGIRG